MTSASGEGGGSGPLPTLRAELQILGDGQDRWRGDGVVFDPLQSRYFRIDTATAELLSLWPRCRNRDELRSAALESYGMLVDEATIAALEAFLNGNGLTVPSGEVEWRRLVARQRAARVGWLKWLVHNYLFVRIPLLRPQRQLERLAPALSFLYSRASGFLVIGCGIAGLYFVSRQWDQFLATFPHFFSFEGVAFYLIALAIVKSMHELGHAITAVRYGCRVPTMGVCFMVGMPLLYTDVTDAWRLEQRRQRLAIDLAGLVVEAAIACIALLAWAFLPDGSGRSLAFALATTGFILSLGFNLNPFMRFDGYYVLMDLLHFENLQPRAFAIARWRLREMLFDLGEAAPEPLASTTRNWLAIYAWATWIYRLLLFLGIAILVYYFAFKLLGIVLFAIEIIYFIARPVLGEIKEWNRMRARILARPRTLVTGSMLLAAIVAGVVPWSSDVHIAAIVEDEQIDQFYPPRPSIVVERHARLGGRVEAGGVLLELRSPELERDIVQTRLKLRLVEWRLARRAADSADLAQSLVLDDTHSSLKARLAGLERELGELTVRARRHGVVREIDADLHPGRWLRRTDLTMVVAGGRRRVVRGYVGWADVARIDPMSGGMFIPEDLQEKARSVVGAQVAEAGVARIEIAELASNYGGKVASRPQQTIADGRTLVPVEAQFLVHAVVEADDDAGNPRTLRGTLVISGRPESLAARTWRQVLKVLVRESGM